MEDVAMLFGLRVDGYAVTGHINPQDWRDIVEALVGVRPDEPQEGVKDRKTTGVNSSWLVQHFGHLPPQHANAFSSCGCGSGFQLVGKSATHLVYVICISNVLKHLSFEFLFIFGTMLQDLPYDGDVPLATVGYL
jgi:hypothetical protein